MTDNQTRARAKINLTLRVVGRRADGFHELDSIVAFADVADHVTRTTNSPAEAARVDVTGPFASAIRGTNIVATTLEALTAVAPTITTGSFLIDKQLPVAAGVGGGSADAAAVLRLIRDANLGVAGVDWNALSLQLGSDVPVCLLNRACRMTGRGEMLTEIVDLPKFPAVLVNPMTEVPADKTRQVFQILNALPCVDTKLKPAQFPTNRQSWLEFIAASGNDLEAPASRVVPAVSNVLATMHAHHLTVLARVSGAGPTCFALTASADDSRSLAQAISQRNPTWWVRATEIS